jgi:hypothetical protein
LEWDPVWSKANRGQDRELVEPELKKMKTGEVEAVVENGGQELESMGCKKPKLIYADRLTCLHAVVDASERFEP